MTAAGRCPDCGVPVACGRDDPGGCWCADRPPLPAELRSAGGCLCPACLERRLGKAGVRPPSAMESFEQSDSAETISFLRRASNPWETPRSAPIAVGVGLALSTAIYAFVDEKAGFSFSLALGAAAFTAFLIVRDIGRPDDFPNDDPEQRKTHSDPDVEALLNGEIDLDEYGRRKESGGRSGQAAPEA